ncbi:MAG: hypothetical protein U0359_31670 [Byssovorax sp.]
MRARYVGLVVGLGGVLAGCPDPIANPGTTSTSGSGGGMTTTSTTTSTGSTGGGGSGGAPAGPVVKGVFVSGAVAPMGGDVRVRGQVVWHARVSEGNGSVKVKGWLR